MRLYEVYNWDKDTSNYPFDSIRCNSIAVEGGSIIFFDVRRTEPKAVYPASKFYVMEVSND